VHSTQCTVYSIHYKYTSYSIHYVYILCIHCVYRWIRTSVRASRPSVCCMFAVRSDWPMFYRILYLATLLTLSILMSYIYGAHCKDRNFNVVYIWTYVWQRWKPSLSICCPMFQHWINAESYPVAQLCVNTLPAAKVNYRWDLIRCAKG
jgi:hypothetical protein